MLTRSWFRKRSKIRPCWSGSRLVIPSAKETSDPAALPRPGPVRDRVLAGEVVEVPDDQEVGGVAGLGDDGQFGVGPLPLDRGRLPEAPAQPLLDPLPEVGVGRHPLGDVEGRQEGLAESDLDVAAVGDVEGAGEGVGQFPEEPLHLLRGLDVEILGAEAPALGIVVEGAGLETEEHVVGLGVALLDVMEVVGRREAEAELLPEPDQCLVDRLLLLDSVPLDLQEVVLGAEDVTVGRDRLPGSLGVQAGDLGGHLTGQAAAQGDEAPGMAGEHLLVDPGLVIEALQVADRAELHQVQVALAVPGQDGQVVRVAVGPALPLVAAPGSDVELAADDRPDAGVEALLVELHRAVHDPVVGESHRGHPQLGRLADQPVDPARAIEEGVLGVVVEVDEAFRGVGHCFEGRGWRAPRLESLR